MSEGVLQLLDVPALVMRCTLPICVHEGEAAAPGSSDPIDVADDGAGIAAAAAAATPIAAAAVASPPPPPRTHGRHVAVSVDGRAAGISLVHWTLRWILRPSDAVTFVHSRTGVEQDVLSEAEAEIGAYVELTQCTLGPTASVAESSMGSPVVPDAEIDVGEQLVDWLHAQRNAVDLTVMGSRGLTGCRQRIFMASATSFALQFAPCAVLVVPIASLNEY